MFTYRKDKDIDVDKLVKLFTSVGWVEYSANYPNRLYECIKNSDTVFTCWDEEELVGLLSSISDTFHVFPVYLLVNPKYQRLSIGKKLMRLFDNHYSNHYKWIVTCTAKNYYQKFGYEEDKDVLFLEKFSVIDDCEVNNG